MGELGTNVRWTFAAERAGTHGCASWTLARSRVSRIKVTVRWTVTPANARARMARAGTQAKQGRDGIRRRSGGPSFRRAGRPRMVCPGLASAAGMRSEVRRSAGAQRQGEPRRWFEPAQSGLATVSLTGCMNEYTIRESSWWLRVDSNHRHRHYECEIKSVT